MSQGVRRLLDLLVVAQAILLLVPSSIVCGTGLFFAVALVASSPANPAWHLLLGCVALLAYALASLWWLIFKHRSIQFSRIPRFIWAGLTFGVIAALLLSFPHLFAMAFGAKSIGHSARYVLDFGAGPLIVLVTVLVAIHYRAKASAPGSLPDNS